MRRRRGKRTINGRRVRSQRRRSILLDGLHAGGCKYDRGQAIELIEQVDQIAVFEFVWNEEVVLRQAGDRLVFVGHLDLDGVVERRLLQFIDLVGHRGGKQEGLP